MSKLHVFLIFIFCTENLFAQQIKKYEPLVATSEITVKNDGSTIEVVEIVNRVLTEEGRSELSAQKAIYDGASSKFKFLEAFTSKDGKIIPVDPKTIKSEKVDTKALALTNIIQVTVPFNKVTIGSEVHFKYQITKSPTIKNIFADVRGISNITLAKKEYVKYISDEKLQMYSENPDSFFEILEQKSGNKYITILAPTVKAYNMLGMTVNSATVYFSNAKNWKSIREIEAPLYKKAWNVELPAKLEKIVLNAKLKKENSEIIEYFAEEIKKLIAYSGDWTSKDGQFQPAGISKSLFRGKGDCKDYSTLMVALLRKLNFEAYPFLTFRSDNYLGDERLNNMSKVPNLMYFNHVIVWAKDKSGKVWWIDPTNPYVKADVITGDILGNFGLLLDDKSNEALFLPKANLKPADFKLENAISIQPDNSIFGSGSATMSASSYNMIEMTAARLGPEIKGKIFSVILNPVSKSTKVNLQREPDGYKFTYHGADWVREELGKYKSIILFNQVGLLLNKVKPETEVDLGETGTTTVISRITGQKEIDVIQAGCLLRSKWLDADRYVENKNNEIVVTDVIKSKIRFISKAETIKNPSYDEFYSKLISCAKNSEIVLYTKKNEKDIASQEEEKIKGPPLEKMTDIDAKQLIDGLSGPNFHGYKSLKLFRYNEVKIKSNPKNSESYNQMAIAIANLGYQSGDTYATEYLDEAITYLNLALQYADKNSEPKYYSLKIKYLLLLKNESEAIKQFADLYKKYPQNIYSYRSGFRIADFQKKNSDAEKWALSMKKSSVTDEDLMVYNSLMYSYYLDKKRYKEAIPHGEYFINRDKNDAWSLHNLAILYLNLKEFDKCIELEKKAISISEFGAAKSTLSDAYRLKSFYSGQTLNVPSGPLKGTIVRISASTNEDEKLMLESLKYDPQNYSSLIGLARYYVDLYEKSKNKEDLSKGDTYLRRAVEANPKASDLQEVILRYQKNK